MGAVCMRIAVITLAVLALLWAVDSVGATAGVTKRGVSGQVYTWQTGTC